MISASGRHQAITKARESEHKTPSAHTVHFDQSLRQQGGHILSQQLIEKLDILDAKVRAIDVRLRSRSEATRWLPLRVIGWKMEQRCKGEKLMTSQFAGISSLGPSGAAAVEARFRDAPTKFLAHMRGVTTEKENDGETH